MHASSIALLGAFTVYATCLDHLRSVAAYNCRYILTEAISTIEHGKPPPVVPSPPLSCPTPGKTVPCHPLGDSCQVTIPPPPPLRNRTTTVHAHFQAQKLHCKTKRIQHQMRLEGFQCTETYSLTSLV